MKICRIDMGTKIVSFEEVKPEYTGLGGRGLTSRIISDEVDAASHPLGKNNKLVIAPGLFAGTLAPSSGRLSVGTKSPLTGGIKESNAGGTAAQSLAKLGYKAIIIENKPENQELNLIKITPEGVTIEDAGYLKMKGNYDVGNILREKCGEKVTVMSVGQAGEMRLTAASIAVTDPEGRPTRHCGRGGTGAVLGSKGIKAIVIDPGKENKVEYHDIDSFRTAARNFSKSVLAHPVSGQGLPAYGTAVLVNILNEAGGLPTDNFRDGRFEFAESISGETMFETIQKRKGQTTHACHPGCIMRCSQVYNDKKGDYLTGGFEYETIWAFGAHCHIKDLDSIAKMDKMCDDFGVDTIDTGVAVGVAMEGGYLEFGDDKGALKLLEEIGKGSPIGRIIGNGAAFTGQAFGTERVPVVKRQALPAYDPRSVKGQGVTYATTPMGADHTAGYAVTSNILGVGGVVDPLKKEGQVELSRNLQIATAVLDSLGFCIFVAFPILDDETAFPEVANMINSKYDTNFDINEILAGGQEVLKLEKAFNQRAGITKVQDRLPEFFKEEAVAPHNVTFDFTDEELDKTLEF
ncbi:MULTISPECIES: aldehyde ferredoxin oxidoreductase family protein [Psychrilyobacter]|uniref:Aldehyde ferredoxin oxidoreductase n=1 Tax=Psychrilyobacter piezotolerans TaxID=2293438 RepID=A0ABX9KL19_9FUSO|nr:MULTISPECIES: aldehyde ferredoxin oxidoreductase C-terminal domain-containing protein [Psychrilyobacter]MCS5422614.1 aldehyde ferredoxin oxidoreductase [Psychrilyobacter sp. S5]NDI76484.1 aldehyde ferredoxin oxidoreductase [Psychrilyobacter piezotolerans]RDE66077.1 aldehyde ferredoxin oxidoreductase [Psychrilyobacter sp. S5]REI43255.1 aldehyde ferredoxin oxidoreductase [Psychrilyobacter piezotolerans]